VIMMSTYALNINYCNRCNSLLSRPSNDDNGKKPYKMRGTYVTIDLTLFDFFMAT